MKHSIRVRLALTLAALIVSTILLCWVMNKTFLPSYYEKYKVSMLGKAYDTVCSIYDEYVTENSKNNENKVKGSDTIEDVLDSEISLALESLGANQNLNLYVVRLYKNQVGVYAGFLYPSMDIMRKNLVLDQIRSFSFTNVGDEREVLKDNQNYQIVKAFDRRMDSYYLELFGNIDNSTIIYVRSNYQSMMESVTISNQFLAYIGIIVTIIGIIIMYIVSRSFTKPILELSEIANSMSHLDFNVRYKLNRNDEIGTLGNSINVLSEKLVETISELKSANNELQKDIEYKTKVDEMRTEFLSNVSHELKTPIALIQGYAEGLMENINEDEESRQFYCEVITDEAVKMNKMVKKLLSLNHIEFGENPVSFEHFDLISLIKQVLSSMDILFQQKQAILHFANYVPVYVWADEYLVEEVLTNYISNALNHVDGKRIVEIKVLIEEETVRVAVFNTGENIPEEDVERVWDKFYKVDKARTREYGGSGIGLSIVKAIMSSLNQKYGVMNRESGVEFWFELDCKN